MSSAKTIVLKGHGVRSEALASVAVTPGMLVIEESTGKVKPHNVAGGNARAIVAVEDDLQGRAISTDYAIGDLVQYNAMAPGDECNMLLANGSVTAIGSMLESAGDGTLQVHVADTQSDANVTQQVLFVAREAVDMSDSSGADPATARVAVAVI